MPVISRLLYGRFEKGPLREDSGFLETTRVRIISTMLLVSKRLKHNESIVGGVV